MASWQAQGQDKDSVVADPMIVAPEQGDWRLIAGSPALQRGFVQLKMSTVGPRVNHTRYRRKLMTAVYV